MEQQYANLIVDSKKHQQPRLPNPTAPKLSPKNQQLPKTNNSQKSQQKRKLPEKEPSNKNSLIDPDNNSLIPQVFQSKPKVNEMNIYLGKLHRDKIKRSRKKQKI